MLLSLIPKEKLVMRKFLVVLSTALSTAAFADTAGITVDHAWSRAASGGATGAIYLSITDQGQPDTLTAASTPVAQMTELHETIDDHGVMKMRSVANLPVTPGKTTTFAPGGYHIMLMGLKQDLAAGSTFPVTLTFAHAGPVTVTVTVQKMGGESSDAMHGSGAMNHMHMEGSGAK
jgi:periplasmic copper chaperone A